jgi:hypothetical protein
VVVGALIRRVVRLEAEYVTDRVIVVLKVQFLVHVPASISPNSFATD